MALKSAENRLSSLSLANKNVLVVGGTAGIGQGIATRMAQMGAKVIIAGRNEQAGNSIVAQIQGLGKGSAEFRKLDGSLVTNCKSFARAIVESGQPLDYLVITAGMMRMGGRQETSEGLDDKMTVHYYGRFALISELLPVLEKASGANGEARVLSVLAAAQGKMGDENDLDLKKGYSLKACADACTFYNDCMVESLSKKSPTVGFVHAFPGIISSDIGRNLPWYFKAPAEGLMKIFGRSIDDCGTFLVDGLLAPERKTGWHLMGDKGNVVKPSSSHNDQNREKVWKHTVELLEKIQ